MDGHFTEDRKELDKWSRLLSGRRAELGCVIVLLCRVLSVDLHMVMVAGSSVCDTNTRVLEYNYTNIQYLYWDYFLPVNICIDLTTASHH